MTVRVFFVFLVGLLCCFWGWPCYSQGLTLDSAISYFGRSVPLVVADLGHGSYGKGSGTYIGNRWVISASHVTGHSGKITCKFNDRKIDVLQAVPARDCDAVLLKLAEDPGVPPVPLYDGDLRRGQVVFCVGYDRGSRYRWFDSTVRNGLTGPRGERVFEVQSSRCAVPGNSGGPVLSTNGRLVGVINSSDWTVQGQGSIAVHPRTLSRFAHRAAERYPDLQALFAGAQPQQLQLTCPDGTCPTAPQAQARPQATVPKQPMSDPLGQLGQLQLQPASGSGGAIRIKPQIQPSVQVILPSQPLLLPIPLQLRIEVVP